MHVSDPRQSQRWLDRHFRWRGTEVTRMEAFADSVFALVLALTFLQEVPKSFGQLKEAIWGLIPFGITFVILAMIWADHHLFFRRYGLRDKTTFHGNLLLLFLIMVFAFPLKFLFTSLLVMWFGPIGNLTEQTISQGVAPGDDTLMMIFYSSGFGGIYAILWVMYRHALRRADDLRLDDVERHATMTSMLNCLVYVGFAMASIALMLLTASSPIAGLIYGGIGPVMFALHFWRDRQFKRLLKARES